MTSGVDWPRVERLRAAFLAALERPGTEHPTPWRDVDDLAAYDATLGARIGWKWHAVLAELSARGFQPPAGELVDWGCGTGVASRAVLAAFADWRPDRLRLWDRARMAAEFAAERARAEFADLPVTCDRPGEREPGLLLVSHVLNELAPAALEGLVQLALRARAVVWVENGAHATSRALSQVRERLKTELELVAPCPHQAACGVLAAGNEREWCHHFARPPVEAFQSAHWAEFSRRLGIDLRALTYSFLCLARPEDAPAQAELQGATRVLGRPHVQKGRLTLHACDAQGVRPLELRQRDDKALFKALEDAARGPQVYRFELAGERIAAGRALFTASERS